MATFSRVPLSASSNGRGIKVVATATAGTTIHTTGTSASVYDEVWLYAYNSHSASLLLTIEFGGATSPDDHIKVTIPSQTGLTLVVPGLTLVGTGSAGVTVAAFAASANLVTIQGHVNRIS